MTTANSISYIIQIDGVIRNCVRIITCLDSAVNLCENMVSSPKKQIYSKGVVILYLTFHAVELFLKGAILKKAPNEPLNHKVEEY